MKEKFQLKNRKGQSAIEYLMTYGWMLLVVAIVGGAIFATVQDNQNSCEKQIMDIESTQQGFGVSEFTTTSSSLNIELENNQRDEVEVSNVTVGGYQASETSGSNNVTLGFGDTQTVTISQITQDEENCGTFDITIEYTQGNLPSERTGTLQGQMSDSS